MDIPEETKRDDVSHGADNATDNARDNGDNGDNGDNASEVDGIVAAEEEQRRAYDRSTSPPPSRSSSLHDQRWDKIQRGKELTERFRKRGRELLDDTERRPVTLKRARPRTTMDFQPAS